jgi:uncharacterized LabA/DUF88 family protein
MSAGLFVDGAALDIGMRRLGFSIDVARLVEWAESIAGPIAVRYWFDATLDGGPHGFHNAAARVGGFRLKISPKAPRPAAAGSHISYKQVGVDVSLTVEAMRSVDRDRWDHLILIAGDGDFYPLAEHLVEERGVQLTLLGSPETSSAMLTCYATTRYRLSELADRLARPQLYAAK